jgi:hypothetical protein
LRDPRTVGMRRAARHVDAAAAKRRFANVSSVDRIRAGRALQEDVEVPFGLGAIDDLLVDPRVPPRRILGRRAHNKLTDVH